MTRKLAVEGIGTFFFVLVIGLVVVGSAGALAPLAIGSALMVVVYAGGHISGGHYNPAVTLSVWMRGGVSAAEVLPYWVAQIVGAGVAAGFFRYLAVDAPVPAVVPVGPSLVAEFLFTLLLCFVVLNVATVASVNGNSYYGLAIGFAVVIGAYAVGSISGGAFNPAVAVGLVGMGIFPVGALWIYLVANLAGGAVAALLFNGLDLGSERSGG